jgi:integrase
MPPLTNLAVRNAKPEKKTRRLFDGGGLYLEVAPTGSRYWRLKYRYGGKEKRLALGVFPEVTLTEARERRDDARLMLRNNRDPGFEKKQLKRQLRIAGANTFGAIKKEWLEKQEESFAPHTYAKAVWLLSLASELDPRPISQISPPEILDVLRRIESRGTHETAHRTQQRISQVLRYAIATGRAERDGTVDLRGALKPVVRNSHAAVTNPAEIGALLRAIDGYVGQPATHAALRLAPMLFARPGNLRAMEWSEIDLDAAEWRIPAGKMKMRESHVIPLATQAVTVLRDLKALTGKRRYCFPSLRTASQPMSENTINAALRRLGYDKHTMTGHGFRALASTRLNELGWSPDVIERQLAHAERNKVKAAYNRAQYMDDRRKMMQSWADYLDGLRADTTKIVVPIRKSS